MRSPVFPLLRGLIRDRIVQFFLASAGALCALVFFPFLPGGQRLILPDRWLEALGMAWATGACWANVGRTGEAGERTFWRLLGASLAVRTAALLTFAWAPGGPSNLARGVASDGMFFVSYMIMLLALEHEPGRPPSSDTRLQRRLRVAGWLCITSSWTAYALMVPAGVVGPAYSRLIPFWMSFLVFDVMVSARLAFVLRSCAASRWKGVFGALLAGTVLGACRDALDACRMTFVQVNLASAGAAVAILLPLGFVVAARLRRGPFDAVPADASTSGGEAMGGLVSIGSANLIAAVGLAGVHVAGLGFGWMPRDLWNAENAIVTVGVISMGALALIAYRMLDRQRAAMQRWQEDVEVQGLETEKMEAIARLAGGVAHEFNNVLTVIGGFAELAMDGGPTQGPVFDALAGVRSAADRATVLTRQLLTIGRRGFASAQAVCLNDTVRALENAMRRIIRPGVALVTDLDPNLGPVSVNPGQIEQVIVNLVVNASDAMPDGGTLTITTRAGVHLLAGVPGRRGARPDAYVLLQVADTGHGIPPDILPRIFEPFFSTKEPDKGTGLGLATVYGIVRQSGGVVTVSTAANVGTTFSVHLPPLAQPVSAEVAEPQPAAVPGTETILLAEDEPAVRDLATSILRRAGYTVLAAANGEEALRIHGGHRGRIDLLLTDVIMPGMSGRVLAERILASQPGVRVLFMTGYSDDALVRHGVLDGRFSLLPKPFSAHSLTSDVRRVLDRHATRPASRGPA